MWVVEGLAIKMVGEEVGVEPRVVGEGVVALLCARDARGGGGWESQVMGKAGGTRRTRGSGKV